MFHQTHTHTPHEACRGRAVEVRFGKKLEPGEIFCSAQKSGWSGGAAKGKTLFGWTLGHPNAGKRKYPSSFHRSLKYTRWDFGHHHRLENVTEMDHRR
jgi:hypothetical protein